jgi:hypothetical protein
MNDLIGIGLQSYVTAHFSYTDNLSAGKNIRIKLTDVSHLHVAAPIKVTKNIIKCGL